MITLVNDNHADNYLKEILAFVYDGSIINNQLKKVDTQEYQPPLKKATVNRRNFSVLLSRGSVKGWGGGGVEGDGGNFLYMT